MDEIKINMENYDNFLDVNLQLMNECKSLPLQKMKDIYSKADFQRHEIFSMLFARENNMEVITTDENPIKKFLSLLEIEGFEKELRFYTDKSKNPQFVKKRYTPDIVDIKINRKEDDSMNLTVDIIDVAVTRNPTKTTANKFEKYQYLREFFPEENTSLSIVMYNVNNEQVVQKVWGAKAEWSIPNLDEFSAMVKRSELLKLEIKRKVSSEEQDDFFEWLNSGHRDEECMRLFSENFDMSLTVNEFINFMKKKNRLNYFKEMENEEFMFFWNLMKHRLVPSEDDETNFELLKNEFAKNLKLMNHKNWENYMEEKMLNFTFESGNHVPEKGYPEKPEFNSIEDAMKELKVKASKSYSSKSKGGLLYPLPFTFSINPIKEKGPILKKRRMERVINVLENVKLQDRDGIWRAVHALFSAAKMSDEEYNKFKTGEIVHLTNGEIIEKKKYIENLTEINREQVRRIQNSTYEERHNLLAKKIKEGKVKCLHMKKGEVIVVRPSNDSDMKELLDSAGVGRKHKNEGSTLEETKIKSLPFWSEEDVEIMDDEFKTEVSDFFNIMDKLTNRLKEIKYDFSKLVTKTEQTDRPATEAMSSEEETEDEKIMTDSIRLGLNFFMRNNELFFENLNFVSHMANSGFRIIQGNSDNTFLITMPSESLFKGDTQIPYICVSLVQKGDIYKHFQDHNITSYKTPFGSIFITMGRRLDRNRLTGYLRSRCTFETAMMCLNHFRRENKLKPMNGFELCKLCLFINNININTSSLLDNVRYMAELCMADFSFCREYIREKLLVPVKNILQLHLFSCMEKMLKNLNEDMRSVKIRHAIVDQDGKVNMDAARITEGSFTSFFFDDIKYQKMEGLISEIQVLFFSIPKGLHGKYHNLMDIHLTPIKIQEEINRKFSRMNPSQMSFVKEREEYNPVFVALASIRAEDSVSGGICEIRQRFMNSEYINSSPLSGKTTASTKSTLIEDKRNVDLVYNEAGTLFNLLTFLDDNERDEFISTLENCESQMKKKKTKTGAKQVWKSFKRGLKHKFDNREEKNIKLQNFVENTFKLNIEERRILIRPEYHVDKMKIKAKEVFCEANKIELSSHNNTNIKFYQSGVVLSEVIKHAFRDKNENSKSSYYTIGKFSKESVLRDESWKFAIRPKGQRTQKDREIYVLDLYAKFGLYPLEHFYKQLSVFLEEEKISEPGDTKIISMKSQVEQGFSWMGRKLKMQRKGDIDDFAKPMVLHLNLDMTKWAPKDNLYKFIIVIISSRFLKLEEKLYMIASIIKLSEKELYIDPEVYWKTFETKKRYIVKESDPCAISRMTSEHKTNFINITLTWLQGQLNYISSFLHAGTMLLWSDVIKKAFGQQTLTQVNVHSDDNQMSLYLMTPLPKEIIIQESWRRLDYMTRQVCIEISIKKSYISTIIKQFISQYNIAGEQVYLWVKSLMASISGCPYTNLKDDISSIVSKVSEALSKGAPKDASSRTIRLMKEHILSVYGIRTKEGKNLIAEILEIPEEYLPMALGGCDIKDFSTLAISGPKCVDQMNLMHLLKTFHATSIDPPRERPINTIFKTKIIDGIKLFYILDKLSDEIPDEEDSSFSGSLNPLRVSRFKMRRTGDDFPFNIKDEEEKKSCVLTIKKNYPGVNLLKPRDPELLSLYYFLLFCNHNFKAALAGQSPNLLMMHKMVNKNKGIFLLKESDPIHVKLGSEKDFSSNLTGEELGKLFKILIDREDLNHNKILFLWSKYIKGDPEFKILWYVKENAKPSGVMLRPNPFPMRKPNFSEYSEIINHLPSTLCYLFDYKYFKRNNFKLNNKRAIINDIEQLCQIFPTEIGYLFWECNKEWQLIEDGKMPFEDADYQSIHLLRKEGLFTKEINHRINKMLKGVNELFDTLGKRLMQEIERETRNLKISMGEELELQELITSPRETKYSKDESRVLIADRLLKMARIFKPETRKVIFCPPTVTRDITDMATSLRSQIESRGRVAVNYTIGITHHQALMMSKFDRFSLNLSKLKLVVLNISNLYSVARKLGINKNKMELLMRSAKMYNIGLNEIRSKYKELPRYIKTRALCPLITVFPESSDQFLKEIDPISIVWLEDEDPSRNMSYRALVRSENVEIEVIGKLKKMDKIIVRFSGELYPNVVNKALKVFIADLISRNRSLIWKHKLYDTLKGFRKITKESKPALAYSVERDAIVGGETSWANHWIKGLVVMRDEEVKFKRRYHSIRLEDDLTGITYRELGRETFQAHKDYKNQGFIPMEFEDVILSGMSLKKLSERSMFRYILTGDYCKISLREYINLIESSGTVTKLIGGTSANVFLEMFIPVSEMAGECLNTTLKYLKDVDDFIIGKRKSQPRMKFPKVMEDDENELTLKQSRWSEIMERKSKMDLRYAQTLISFIDVSSEVFENAVTSGVNLDDLGVDLEDLDNYERNVFNEETKVELELLLKEASPEPMNSDDIRFQSLILVSILYSFSMNYSESSRNMELTLKEMTRRKNYSTIKLIERACLESGRIAFTGIIGRPTTNPFENGHLRYIENFYDNKRKQLSGTSLELYKVWKIYSCKSIKIRETTQDIDNHFKSIIHGKKLKREPVFTTEIRRSLKLSAFNKTIRDNPVMALKAIDNSDVLENLNEKSKYYESGTATETATSGDEVEEDDNIIKLKRSYPDTKIGKSSKLILMKTLMRKDEEEESLQLDFSTIMEDVQAEENNEEGDDFFF